MPNNATNIALLNTYPVARPEALRVSDDFYHGSYCILRFNSADQNAKLKWDNEDSTWLVSETNGKNGNYPITEEKSSTSLLSMIREIYDGQIIKPIIKKTITLKRPICWL